MCERHNHIMFWVLGAILVGTNIAVFRVIVPALVNLQNDAALLGAILLSLLVVAVDGICVSEFFNREGSDQS
jgi:hypothetical protein